MKRMNLGCGPNILQGFDNVDIERKNINVMFWDARNSSLGMEERYDFILINHVLCTMNFLDVEAVLSNMYKILKPGGKVQIIDMDMELAIYHFRRKEGDFLPASGDTIDEKFCNHVSGFGTRKSLYTEAHLINLLTRHGFKKAERLTKSDYDLRPNESLIVEATK